MTEDDFLRAVRNTVAFVALHELDEAFLVDGVRMFEPHIYSDPWSPYRNDPAEPCVCKAATCEHYRHRPPLRKGQVTRTTPAVDPWKDDGFGAALSDLLTKRLATSDGSGLLPAVEGLDEHGERPGVSRKVPAIATASLYLNGEKVADIGPVQLRYAKKRSLPPASLDERRQRAEQRRDQVRAFKAAGRAGGW